MVHADTLKAIVGAGGSIDISIEGQSLDTRIALANSAAVHPDRPRIVLRVNSAIQPQTMARVARAGSSCVMFRFGDFD
ncbi:hypothetical protein ASF34_21850 [Methylobacterium sp. Leaf106]|nr:hypothetical protein ASF34_21850 [Methylobacterium sp. Leaf106]